tara:strand:+ start:1968 stop:2405 length:438 start_codon:yes stop_codon:yes gene_type:complete
MAEETFNLIKDSEGEYLFQRTRQIANTLSPSFISNNIELKDYHTGATVLIPTTGAASTITLPAARLGLQYKLVCAANNGNHSITIAGKFAGTALDAGAVAPVNGTTSAVIAGLKFKKGDYLELTCDGEYWLANGMFNSSTAISAS